MTAFKTDENLPLEIATMLRQLGHDAMSVHEQSMNGFDDKCLIDICATESRALITLDLDFSDIRRYAPEKYAGIIVLRPKSQSKTHVIDLIQGLANRLASYPVSGQLWIVDEAIVRIRSK